MLPYCYQLLGVSPSADAKAINKAFYMRVLECHPDKEEKQKPEEDKLAYQKRLELANKKTTQLKKARDKLLKKLQKTPENHEKVVDEKKRQSSPLKEKEQSDQWGKASLKKKDWKNAFGWLMYALMVAKKGDVLQEPPSNFLREHRSSCKVNIEEYIQLKHLPLIFGYIREHCETLNQPDSKQLNKFLKCETSFLLAVLLNYANFTNENLELAIIIYWQLACVCIDFQQIGLAHQYLSSIKQRDPEEKISSELTAHDKKRKTEKTFSTLYKEVKQLFTDCKEHKSNENGRCEQKLGFEKREIGNAQKGQEHLSRKFKVKVEKEQKAPRPWCQRAKNFLFWFVPSTLTVGGGLGTVSFFLIKFGVISSFGGPWLAPVSMACFGLGVLFFLGFGIFKLYNYLRQKKLSSTDFIATRLGMSNSN